MASDEEDDEEIIVTSRISELTLKVNTMLKKPTLDMELAETLDSFMAELSISEHYLANGIVNIKFAEAGLFLQSSASLYSKKVDLLWDNTLQYQMELCSHTKSKKENVEETDKITQRLNRNKRKKIVHEVVETVPLHENLMKDLDHSNKVLNLCSSLNPNDNHRVAWKEINKNRVNNRLTNVSSDQAQNTPSSEYVFNLNQSVNLDNSEKIGSYSDLHSNRLLPYFGSFSNVTELERIIGGNNQDWLLQKYLKHKGVTCKKLWSEKLGKDFYLFRQRVQEIDLWLPIEAVAVGLPKSSVVNLTRLPDELMQKYAENEGVHVQTMIHDLLVKERQNRANRVKKNSEPFSDDAAYQEDFSECESRPGSRPDVLFMSQQSNVDSGICDDRFPSNASNASNIRVSMDACTSDNFYILNQNVVEDSGNVETTYNNSNFVQSEGDVLSTTINDTVLPANVTNVDINVLSEDNCCTPDNTTPENINQENIGEVAPDDNHISSDVSVTPNNDVNIGVTTVQNNLIQDNCTTVDNLHNGNQSITNNRSSPIPSSMNVTVISVIKPLPERSSKNQKRKCLSEDVDEEEDLFQRQKRKKLPRFKWLPTTITSLQKFERFFVRNYMAEDGEGEPDQGQLDSDLDDEECFEGATEDRIINEAELVHNDTTSLHQEQDVSNNQDCEASDAIDRPDELTSHHMESELDDTVQHTVSESTVMPITQSDISENITENDIVSTLIEDTPPATTADSISIIQQHNEQQSCSRVKAMSDWKSFIDVKLNSLNTKEFDIHEYGTKIIDSIPEGEVLPFKTLVTNEKASEVCRYVLASLQLANTYNIEIITSQEGLVNDHLQFKLLSKERYHEHLEEYEAPSENTFREKLARAKAACPNQVLHSTPNVSSHKKFSRKRLRLSL